MKRIASIFLLALASLEFTNAQSLSGEYVGALGNVLLPPGTCSFDFTIAPEGYSPHTVEGAYYGILYITSLTYKIKPACNKVIIELPRLTDSFFEQYYVKGDYARIQRNSLFWRGVEYKKKHKYNKQYLK